MNRPVRVLMVCLGNICRSPTAEAVLRSRLEQAGLDDNVEVDSAGTGDWHIGQPPDPRAIAHGERRGHRLADLRGRQVSRLDFERFDLILAMDEENLAALQSLQPQGCRTTARLLMSFAEGARSQVIADPYFGGDEGFERALDDIESACDGLVSALKQALLGRGELPWQIPTK